jgi:hypothetical protein
MTSNQPCGKGGNDTWILAKGTFGIQSLLLFHCKIFGVENCRTGLQARLLRMQTGQEAQGFKGVYFT